MLPIKKSLTIVMILLFGTSCDNFGLPAYTPPEEYTPQEAQAAILDINPKYGRIGEETIINITGISSSFDNTTLVSFPDEPAIEVENIRALELTELEVKLYVGIRALPGVHALQVTSETDGTLEYSQGFTLVE